MEQTSAWAREESPIPKYLAASHASDWKYQ